MPWRRPRMAEWVRRHYGAMAWRVRLGLRAAHRKVRGRPLERSIRVLRSRPGLIPFDLPRRPVRVMPHDPVEGPVADLVAPSLPFRRFAHCLLAPVSYP